MLLSFRIRPLLFDINKGLALKTDVSLPHPNQLFSYYKVESNTGLYFLKLR